jgi:hypothetical protein
MKMLSMKKKSQVIAKFSNQVLTVFFKTSEPPLLWHFNLEKNNSFSLSLHRQEGEWEFGVTSAGGTFQPVAHFDDYDTAEGALAAITYALMADKRGEVASASHVRAGVAALFVFALLLGGALLVGRNLPAPVKMTSVQTPVVQSTVAPPNQDGVPVSADDVLEKGQGQ